MLRYFGERGLYGRKDRRMIKLFLILLFFGIFTVLFFRTAQHTSTRVTGTVILLLATVCFSLYAFDIVGVGVSEIMIKLFGMTGEMP